MTPERELELALRDFADRVVPAAKAVARAARKKHPVVIARHATTSARAARRAGRTALVPGRGARTAGLVKSLMEAEAAARAAASANLAACEFMRRTTPPDAVGPLAAMARMQAQAEALTGGGATLALTAVIGMRATMKTREDMAATADAVRTMTAATVQALEVAERRSVHLPTVPVPAEVVGSGSAGAVSRRVLGAAVAVLPAAHRVRYREEWSGLLAESPTRRARARHVLSLLAGAPRQAYVLRRPIAGRKPA